jgi:hypothetical protein
MVNDAKRRTLEYRLQIIDVLESLITLDPVQPVYHRQVSDFDAAADENTLRGHFQYLTSKGVAEFILPRTPPWGFPNAVVRIKNIDPSQIRLVREATKRELRQISPRDHGNRLDVHALGQKVSWLFQSGTRIILAAAALITAFAIIIGTVTHGYRFLFGGSGASVTGTITDPINGAVVPSRRFLPLSGTAQNVSRGHFLWLFLQFEGMNVYYPADFGSLDFTKGGWSGSICVGDPGHITIWLVDLGPNAFRVLNKDMRPRNASHVPTLKLAPDETVLHSVNVIGAPPSPGSPPYGCSA